MKAFLALASLALLAACTGTSEKADLPPGDGVDGAAIAQGRDGEWLSYGRTYDEQRYSPLDKINTGNAGQLGLAWSADLDTARGQEGTPLVIDGKIYISTAWSKAKAYDAATGKLIWDYDPKVPGETGVKACCDVVNRGLAAWGDKLFLGTLDGRLIALDRATGKQLWSVITVDTSKNYTITGAPRVVGGMVIIGNGGAEYGVRGYVTAYSVDTGRQIWRFYTVPDQPGRNAPDYLRKAEATWHGDYWKLGGGGTVWDSMAYDPALDLLYIGVGNGSPWNQAYRSPGGGDNLYLSSIVAIHAKTGEYAWHFQETPGETWDYTATQPIMLADLTIDGKPRKVLMHAPKNGFFYVLDRTTGQFISGKNFVAVNWATGLDKNGRPIENPASRYDKTGKPWIGSPGPGGAHSWHPMAYDPKEGLVFIPAQITSFPFIPEAGWKPSAMGFNTGDNFGAGAMPADTAVRNAALAATKGALIAWDPVAQKARWRVDYKGPWNGGLLATAGGLLFQGTAAGNFVAYTAKDGKPLWTFDAQTGIMAPPVTYSIKGEQYVAVLAGWGGSYALSPGIISGTSGNLRNISRLLVFKLGGTASLPKAPPVGLAKLDPPADTASPEVVKNGAYIYGRYCGVCHGDAAISGGVTPDLRHSAALGDTNGWQAIVHDGALKDNGMVGWSKILTPSDVDSIRAYVIHRANEDMALEAAGSSK
ncbi:PQQ-dependent dehydrogenase, methanol/ethanol family [Sphingobium nicotianae]|uniref:PQQ-dependent dehydrogenase, methanol/ethanol family n=1 Tax=Sphingobium nicotianae TaxID=2782607 RepID=A0A9X1IQW7_9SPHN|nr:PQQ-dependent dehydrogenase, methanol/ethanol family [Sphingobium nicotianae]MBT2187018.1 PQQ-dependent dehydrogenase, methanol/ethanol family [Sphingobium nicotianae]